eukprot:7348947-Alexandrium_andersonii.AAC.1
MLAVAGVDQPPNCGFADTAALHRGGSSACGRPDSSGLMYGSLDECRAVSSALQPPPECGGFL